MGLTIHRSQRGEFQIHTTTTLPILRVNDWFCRPFPHSTQTPFSACHTQRHTHAHTHTPNPIPMQCTVRITSSQRALISTPHFIRVVLFMIRHHTTHIERRRGERWEELTWFDFVDRDANRTKHHTGCICQAGGHITHIDEEQHIVAFRYGTRTVDMCVEAKEAYIARARCHTRDNTYWRISKWKGWMMCGRRCGEWCLRKWR